jgi:glycosyltransferase involved in cell wall biosynthesis
MSESRRPEISVVVPVHDEQDNVVPLFGEIRDALGALGRPFEIVFVDDGSSDATLERLAPLRDDPRLRVLELDRNFGEAAALSAGFHHATGEIVVTLDGDGQNDPADIPRLLEALERDGIRAVSGRREQRREGYWLRVLPSRIANALIVRVSGVPVQDCGCGLKAYRRGALGAIHLPRGMNRFLPALLGVRAAEVAEVPTRDRARRHGRSHYGIGRTFAVLRDLLALPFLIRNPRRSEIGFALATAAAGSAGALLLPVSAWLTAACDSAAIVSATIWWNARRFNRTQEEGAYQLRGSDIALGQMSPDDLEQREASTARS